MSYEMYQFTERCKHRNVLVQIISVKKDVKKLESSYTTGGDVKWWSSSAKQSDSSKMV